MRKPITITLAVGSLAIAAITGLSACGSTHAVPAPKTPPASTAPAAPAPTATTPEPAYTPPPEPATFGLPIGSSVTMTDDSSGAAWDVTLNSVHGATSGAYEDPPKAGMRYIRIDVTYDVTTGPADINEWDWTAKDPSGLVSEVQMVSGSNDISATTHQTGGKTRGTVTLAIPAGSGGTVVYSAGGSERASWAFTAAQAAS